MVKHASTGVKKLKESLHPRSSWFFDKANEAETYIEHLRKNDVGRASLTILEKLPENGPEQVNPPEGVPRLFDLAMPNNPRTTSAIDKAVESTLAVNNMD